MATSYLQSNHATGNIQFADLTCAFSSNVTASSLIVAVVFYNFTPQTLNLSDTQGNTYAAAGSAAENVDFVRCKMFYAIAGSSGSNTVKIATTGVNSSTIELVILEYSGLLTTGQPDASAQSVVGSTSVSITTATDHCLIVAAAVDSSAYPGTGTGYTNRFQSAQYFADVNDKLDATPAGTYSGEFSSAVGNMAKVAASFKPAGGTVAVKRLLTLGAG